MFMFGHLLDGLASVVDTVLYLYTIIIVVSALLSWVSPDPRNPIVQFLNGVTWPLYYQIRKRIPVVFGGIDLTPLVAILGIQLISRFLVGSLRTVALRLIQL